MSGTAYIATSGFTYDDWKGRFYPPEVKKRAWLEYYCQHFDTVEINYSYYHMPRANVCESWRQRTPDGFCFVMKLYGGITHRRRLVDCEELLASYLESVDLLGDKLGPILVQLPPKFNVDANRLDKFLDICSSHHRWAVEFRNTGWLCEDVYAVLRAHKAALVVHDLIQGHPEVVTADWTYLRFHGTAADKYHGEYGDDLLAPFAARIREHLAAGRDVYAYFNNDYDCHAVYDALRLKRLVMGRNEDR